MFPFTSIFLDRDVYRAQTQCHSFHRKSHADWSVFSPRGRGVRPAITNLSHRIGPSCRTAVLLSGLLSTIFNTFCVQRSHAYEHNAHSTSDFSCQEAVKFVGTPVLTLKLCLYYCNRCLSFRGTQVSTSCGRDTIAKYRLL